MFMETTKRPAGADSPRLNFFLPSVTLWAVLEGRRIAQPFLKSVDSAMRWAVCAPGLMDFKKGWEESPNTKRARCRVTGPVRPDTRGRRPGMRVPGSDGQCHRKLNRPDIGDGVGARVKRCGKSAPREAQATRHGKPHRVQGQIGNPGAARSGFAKAERVPGIGC